MTSPLRQTLQKVPVHDSIDCVDVTPLTHNKMPSWCVKAAGQYRQYYKNHQDNDQFFILILIL